MIYDIQDAFTVNAIMVRRDNLVTWDLNGDKNKVQEIVRLEEFNQVPVTVAGKIVGLTVVKPPSRQLPEDKQYVEVTHEWLVSASTPIRRLVDILDARQHPARFVLDENRISGMVTYADLNTAVARTALYILISRLEIALVRLLRENATNSWKYIQHLSERRRDRFEKLKAEMEEKDIVHDPIEHFNLSDVFRVVKRESAILERLQFASKNKFADARSGINDLRNRVAHSSKLVVESMDGVARLNRRCTRLENLIERVEEI